MLKKLFPGSALILVLAFTGSGCVPSDAEIAADMSAERRAAYNEWMTLRAQGRSREARVDGPLSLDDAIKLALCYNKQLQVAIQEREVARGERISAYAVVLPSLGVTGTHGRQEHTAAASELFSYNAGVTVSQPIFEGGAIPARLRTARFNTALTDENIREQVQELISNVAGYYYDVLLAQHMLEVQREALVSAEAQYRMTSEKKKQETATDYDVLRAQVDVANYQAQMIAEQNNIDSNRVYMLKYMGVSQDSQITFSDKLEFLPMRPVFERAVELASGNRPDLRQAHLSARIADEAVRIARSEFWPKLGATFSQSWGNTVSNNSTTVHRNPWTAGLSANMYFGIDNFGDLHAAKARARQSQLQILDAQERAMQEIRYQMNTLVNAEEQVKALVVNQDAAREALRLVEVGYQAGVRTEVDVTDARKALTEVMGQYYNALNTHTKARLNLQIAMGVLGPSRITDGPIHPPTVPIANIEEFAATDFVAPTPPPIPVSEFRTPPPGVSIPRQTFPQDAPAPAQVPAPATSAPTLSAMDLPLPAALPADAPAPIPQPVAALHSEPVLAAAPAMPATVAESAPAPGNAPAPLFKITVREGRSDASEIAKLGH